MEPGLVLYSLAVRLGLRQAGQVDLASVLDVVRAAGVVMGLLTVLVIGTHPWTEGTRGAVIVASIVAAVIAGVGWLFARTRPVLLTTALTVMAVASGTLTGLSPRSAAIAMGCLVVFSAGDRLRTEVSLGVAAAAAAAFLIAGLVTAVAGGYLLVYPLAFAGLWVLGLTRRAYRDRAEQAEQMLTQTRRTREAENRAAALAERARIAREVHDVLAHTLAAVSVNLQAAEGLLGGEPPPAGGPELAKVADCVGRASALTQQGMAAARRAVLALREDPAPLPEELATLAREYQAVGEPEVAFHVTGEVRQLPAEARLAVYRTAQEALTNARKHAPGQPVTLSLSFEPAQVTVSVTNPIPPGNVPGRLAGTGAGYGLSGLRERAALAGGSIEVGPDGRQWQVRLRVPS